MELDKSLPEQTRNATIKDFDEAFYGFTRLLSSGIRVREDDGEYATKTEQTFDEVNAFLAGFKSEETFPSALNCSKYLEKAVIVFNETTIRWDTLEEDELIEAYIFDIAYWISYTLGPSSRYCFMVGLEGYAWGWTKAEIYDGFVDGFLAWLENLLGNVITFNALYKKITEATDAENGRELMYWYGRLCTLVINFDPIPKDELEFQKLDEADKFVPGVTELIAGLGSAYGAMNLPQKQREFHSAIN